MNFPRLRPSRIPLVAALAAIASSGPACDPSPSPASVANAEGPAPALAPSDASAAERAVSAALAPARESPEPATIRFRDATEASGIIFRHRSGNSPEKYFPTANGSGVAMLDYDGDGLLDLYFASTRELPLDRPSDAGGNRLYRNKGGGSFEDVTDRAGVGFRGFTHGLASGDADGNGWPDLYLANLGGNVLYLNNGDGTFRDASEDSGAVCGTWSSGAAFFDYDADGRLDLYVSCYGKWPYEGERIFCGDAPKGIRTYCSPLSVPPERHFLLHNKGDGTFEDVTEKAGVFRTDGRGMGVVAADLNRDGLTDLFVANDMCPNFLFLNKGDGTFEDLTESSGAAASESGTFQAGMGVDVEDVTGDGLPEIFITHFREDYPTLYRNVDGRNYQDISSWSGIVKDSMTEVGWGCALADFDGDTLPDMMIVNGHVDDNLPALGRDVPHAEPSKVWRGRGEGKFSLVRSAGPFFDAHHVARGAAFGDLDNDGDIDAVVSRLDGPPAVLINESAPHSWIRLELLTGRAPRPALGATVEVHLGDRVLHRQLKGGGSYHSANDPRLLIGLGGADHVDRIDIRWPGGRRSTLDAPEVRKSHRIVEPEGEASR